MKAFLSHSSGDKEIVREISNILGRQKCLFDEQCFETGQDFKNSIENHLEKTSVFVLFASRNSLSSNWVKFEVDEAWYLKLHGKLDKSLIYIIDNELDRDQIPDWLKRALIIKESSPSIIANDIRYHLDNISYESQRQHFLGRTKDQEKLECLINPIDGGLPPKIISISGLPGIGRRTLIKRSSDQLFNMRKSCEIRIEPGDNENDICAKLADLSEPYSCQEELKDIVKEIGRLESSAASDRCIDNLRKLTSAGQLPLMVDEGGVLDENGIIRKPLLAIFNRIDPKDTIYLSLITSRRINDETYFEISAIMLSPLSNQDTKRLILKIANEKGYSLELGEISEISEYVAGYPPAAYFAVKQCVDYGKELLLNDKRKLVKFSTQRFIKHLKKISISNEQADIIRLLASYSPIPLNAIASYCNSEIEKIHDAVYELIDISLVLVDNNSLYKIAEPISNAARNLFGFPKYDRLQSVCTELREYATITDQRKKLDISRVLFRISSIINDEEAKSHSIHLKNDFIRLVQSSYHSRKYKEAIKFGLKAIQECPDSREAREYLIRALIQEEKWDAARANINDMKQYTELKDIYFLGGFLERKKGDPGNAVIEFMESKKLGRGGAALYREIAHCHLLKGDIDEAISNIEEALRIQPDNSHVLDLAAKIYIKAYKESEARRILERLELVDSSEYYYIRKSAFDYRFNRPRDAEVSAIKAVQQGGERFFPARVQLIKCLIKNKKLNQAQEKLNSLDHDYSDKKNDVRIALRCSLFIENDQYEDSLSCVEKLRDKSCKQYNSIR